MAAPLSCRGHEKAALAVALCLLCVTGAAPLSAHDHHHGNHHHHNHRHHHRRHEREGLSTSSTPASPTPAAWVTQTMGQVGWLSRVSQTAGVNKGCACSARKRACPAGGGVLSMKARRKNARSAGGVAGAGGATATAVGRGGGAKKGKKTKALYIQIEDLESDSWRLIEAGEILRKGGVGVIPTDTCYTFACDILSRKGVERILQIKNEQGRHKPLSLLCKDISTMNTYAKGIDKALFKMMKEVLPGPFTFILPSTNEVPRMLIEHKHHKKTWKRKEIGIRLPDAPVLLDLLQQLDGPLLCSSVPSEFPGDHDWGSGRTSAAISNYEEDGESYGDDDDDDDDDDEEEEGISRGAWGDDALVSGDPAAIEAAWGHAVDFVVDAGLLEIGGFSTVVDAVGVEPVVLREGLGDSSLITG